MQILCDWTLFVFDMGFLFMIDGNLAMANIYVDQKEHDFEPEEIWKDIAGYEGLYQINNFGEIKSYFTGKIRKQSISHNGYYKIGLYKNKIKKYLFVHRLVALTFIPNSENKPFVNHKSGNKLNNYTGLLEWCTQSENEIHAHKIGLKNHKGEKSPVCKISNNDICKIRKMILKKTPYRKISNLFKISQSHISSIKHNRRRGK
jgi:hypothetical protein